MSRIKRVSAVADDALPALPCVEVNGWCFDETNLAQLEQQAIDAAAAGRPTAETTTDRLTCTVHGTYAAIAWHGFIGDPTAIVCPECKPAPVRRDRETRASVSADTLAVDALASEPTPTKR